MTQSSSLGIAFALESLTPLTSVVDLRRSTFGVLNVVDAVQILMRVSFVLHSFVSASISAEF